MYYTTITDLPLRLCASAVKKIRIAQPGDKLVVIY